MNTLLMGGDAVAGEVHSTAQVARRLRVLRRALDMTQAQICRETGISASSWNNAETGDHRLSLDQALKIYEVFGVDPTWIYLGHTGFLRQAAGKELADKIEALTR